MYKRVVRYHGTNIPTIKKTAEKLDINLFRNEEINHKREHTLNRRMEIGKNNHTLEKQKKTLVEKNKMLNSKANTKKLMTTEILQKYNNT